MNSNILKTMVIAGIAIFAGYNVYLAKAENNTVMSDIMIANVEALAQGEGGGGIVDDGTCYYSITAKAGSQVRFCGTCTFIPNSAEDFGSLRNKCW